MNNERRKREEAALREGEVRVTVGERRVARGARAIERAFPITPDRAASVDSIRARFMVVAAKEGRAGNILSGRDEERE